MANGKRGAPIGNKNAKGKKVLMSNIGGFITGVVQPKQFNAKSQAVYKKRGAGATGHKVGAAVRRVASLGFK